MRKKLLICSAVVIFLGATGWAQSQNNGGDFQPSSGSGVDNQGIRRYRLGPGDVLDVRVFGQSDLNSTVEVDEDGNISSLPFIEEPIPAKCRNEKEVQKLITDAYAKYILKPRVSVRTLERKSRPPAIVFGAVRMPSRVTMNRRLRLHEVLVTAGGITQNSNGTIDVLHTEMELCTEPDEPVPGQAIASAVAANHSQESDVGKVDSYKINDIKGGSVENNPYIRPGDIVIVNEGEPVFVTGLVNQPRDLVIKDELNLTRALAMAGGPQKMADTQKINIYRKTNGQLNSKPLVVDYDAIRKGKAPEVLLQPYDIIDVRPVGSWSARSVGEVLKSVGTSSLYRIPF
jgi:polysaccharide export outer membrane protein